jgi:hypothetical protein
LPNLDTGQRCGAPPRRVSWPGAAETAACVRGVRSGAHAREWMGSARRGRVQRRAGAAWLRPCDAGSRAEGCAAGRVVARGSLPMPPA